MEKTKLDSFDQDEAKKLAFAKLAYDWSKKVLEDPKPKFRAGKVLKKNNYIAIKTSDYTTSKFSDKAQAMIDKFILDNKLEKEKIVTPNYMVKYITTEDAAIMFKQVLEKEGIEY